MPLSVALPLFLLAALVSLATSWLLVSRLERVGERFGLSEALLGLVAALAADAPEITSAVTALANREQRVGAGVILGSNVFNLAALLGLGALVAGPVRLHPRAVALGGSVALWVAAVSLVTVLGGIPVAAGLGLVGAVLLGYVALLGADRRALRRVASHRRWAHWLRAAVVEGERELETAIRPPKARGSDFLLAALALVVVLGASASMERAAADIGHRYAIPDILVGGLVLAAVTSLPNAVAGIHLAVRGRGAAVLSTSLSSNSLNVAFGLLLPGVVLGLGRPSAQSTLVAASYLALTAVTVGFALGQRGLRRPVGALIVAGYLGFVAALLATSV